MPAAIYRDKASDAVHANFGLVEDVQPSKVKQRAVQLCNDAGLEKLATSIKKAEALTLKSFFSAKTHKEACPFRVIVSERDTWQHSLGLYLQRCLSVLTINDPFLVRRPNEVDLFIGDLGNTRVGAFSVDVKNLYCSLPQDPICQAVSESIDEHGTVRFQNSCGTNKSAFMALLRFYLRSTFVEHEGRLYIYRMRVYV